MSRRMTTALPAALLAALTALHANAASAAQVFDIGLAASGARIDAVVVEATVKSAPTVVLIGSLKGDATTVESVQLAVAEYEKRHDRPVRLLAVPLANPDGAKLVFPPSGVAYREQPEANTLWRWLGTQAPDLVLIASQEDYGLAAALRAQNVADMGRIPARAWSARTDWVKRLGPIEKSAAHVELDSRLARTPRQLAGQLAQHYGRDFDQVLYINAIALLGRLRLGELDEVKRLAEPWVDGTN
jgi:hypothetical protein